MSDETPDPWIDSRLRQVPLPAGLRARLHDAQLDEILQTVDVPARLRGSLYSIPTDAELDGQLRAVSYPLSLNAHLQGIPADEQLDSRLREVPYPAWLAVSVRAALGVHHKKPRAQWAQALALLLLVGLGYALGMAAILHNTFQDVTQASDAVLALRPWEYSVELDTSQPPTLVAFETPADDAEQGSQETPLTLPEEALVDTSPLPAGIADLILYDDAYAARLSEDRITLLFGGILGQPLLEDDILAELLVARPSQPRGIEFPRLRGFDRDLLLNKGFQPTVSLSMNPALSQSHPPIWTSTESFERARANLLAGVRTEPESIHPEDFLAAGDYGFFEPAPGELALRTAAGPAVFGNGQSQYLLIGVQAGQPLLQHDQPTHLVVAVDTSRSMEWDQRLELTRQALRQMTERMRPDDCLSLVGFADDTVTLLEQATIQDRQRMLEAIDKLEPGVGTHLVAGLYEATSLALEPQQQADMALEVVLITDGLGDLPSETREQTAEMMKLAAERGIRWTILDLGRPGHASQELSALANQAEARHLQVGTAEEIRWNLEACLLGSETIVAKDARLEVQFNPQAVLKYRLVGHVPTMGGLDSAAPATLRDRQTAVALYEVWLAPSSDQRVATTTLRWVDPHTNHDRSTTQEISRLQFALTPETSALPLVTAQLLAELAENLAEYPHTTQRSDETTISDLIEYAENVNPRLLQRPSHQRILQLLRAAED